MSGEGPTLIRELDRYVFPWTPDGVRRRILNTVSPEQFGAVGDGVTDDTQAVQAALQAGGRVFLAGTYLVGELSASSSVILEGGTLIPTEEYVLRISAPDFEMYRVSIQGSAVDATPNGRTLFEAAAVRGVVRECHFDQCGVASVTIQADSCEVIGSRFSSYRTGVYAVGVSGLLVRSNLFESVGGAGVVAGYDAVLIETSSDVSIVANRIEESREHGVYIAGGASGFNSDVLIIGNTVSNCEDDGLKVLGVAGRLHTNIAIVNNVLSDGGSSDSAISVGGAENVSVRGNKIRQWANRGVFIRGLVTGCDVSGNYITRCAASGIDLRDLSGALIGMKVTGNYCEGNNTALAGFAGIVLQCFNVAGNTDYEIVNNVCSDYQSVPTQAGGIAFLFGGGGALANVQLIGNSGVGNTGAFFGGSPGSVTGLYIEHVGLGTPEAVITAGVGSVWHRKDGGAGTSLYVKESGAGNTGWIGK